MLTVRESVKPDTGTAAERLQHDGFKCFCEEWFPDRAHFDEHLESHPGKFTVCDCCRRVLPKGSWRVDENHNFVSVDDPAKRAAQ
jgi:hypothetical protein